jgi:hypothetical protein
MPNTVLKSKNSDAMGTNKILEPNPDMVPIISDNKARLKKRAYFSMAIRANGFRM